MNYRGLAGVAVLFMVWGCAAVRPLPPPQVIGSPAELLERLKPRQTQVNSFKARAQITLISPQRTYSGTAILRGQRPHRLKVEVRDILGRAIMGFYSDGQIVKVFFPQEGKLYRGPATPANLAPFIPPPVTLDEVLKALSGDPLFITGGREHLAYEAGGRYLLELTSPEGKGRELLWVDNRDFNPVRLEMYDRGEKRLFTLEFQDFGSLPAGLPKKVVLHTEKPKAELRLTYTEMTVNPPLTEADMALSAPPSVKEEILGP
jgi:outer membrane lipoprotein-sorting protein